MPPLGSTRRRKISATLTLLVVALALNPSMSTSVAAAQAVTNDSWQGTLAVHPSQVVFNARYTLSLQLHRLDATVPAPLPSNFSVHLYAIAPGQKIPTTLTEAGPAEEIALVRLSPSADRWEGTDLRPSAGAWTLVAAVNGTTLLAFDLPISAGEGIGWTLLAIVGLIGVPVALIALALELRRRRRRRRASARRGQLPDTADQDE